ncbi:Retrotransposon Tca5 Polyprotein [Phytophthora megakarya]|uniref:Retrotransposon Tca5 Polyprotein n=1 Tax=Phytophthora megakarya TaxID=4795 RepID=A0A225WW23_9STRA|nr:Retrotransposon Tca5 Polyprotein [Phytophthora megakarya]
MTRRSIETLEDNIVMKCHLNLAYLNEATRYNPDTWIMTMSLMQCMLIGAVNEILNPNTRSEALESDHAEGWAKAMDEEYNSLLQNETWELTYSSVVRIESVRLVLLISIFLGLERKHVDFATAFLNGELNDVVIYMEQPE